MVIHTLLTYLLTNNVDTRDPIGSKKDFWHIKVFIIGMKCNK